MSRTQSPTPIEGRLIEIDGEEYTVTNETPGGEPTSTTMTRVSLQNLNLGELSSVGTQQECFIVAPTNDANKK
jgi:hypothetical protein